MGESRMGSMVGAHIFLTGATGFVGKIVLEELLRKTGVSRITLLIRPAPGATDRARSAKQRFTRRVTKSACARASSGGLAEQDRRRMRRPRPARLRDDGEEQLELSTKITHIVHCAASIEFDLPVKEAAGANITSSLNVLGFAKLCPKLVTMVSVSTAYVTPWKPGLVREELAHLPRPAAELYQTILHGTRDEKDLLAETGHPNTYTYTKCIAEHLLVQNKGNVPLRIVRPSIVSAATKLPFAGWLDSPAAFAGCLLFTGLGIVKTWNADPGARLDVIPVDAVSHHIVEATFDRPPGETVDIRYAVMGVDRAIRVDRAAKDTAAFFQVRPGPKSKPSVFVGRSHHGFLFQRLVKQDVPLSLKRLALLGKKQRANRVRLEKTLEQATYMTKAFAYFTHHTFDFETSRPTIIPGFTPEAYIELVNRGIYKHLMGRDDTQLTLAGAAHEDARNDLAWTLEKPRQAFSIHALGYGLRKTLRKCTERVTFDRASFERAAAVAPPDALFVLAPSHRSYFDFLLTSYLTFQHPELGIPVPFIAAAEEFKKIPIVGRILRDAQAFYIKRGVGKEVPEVTDELRRISARGGSLMFFIEGQRSRSRRILPPKRGLLRGLQATGKTFAVLPITISYDRLPEEAALARELGGGRRSKMSIKAIGKWMSDLVRGKSQLGRVHIACAEPIVLDRSTDIHKLGREITAALQHHTSISSFHLRTFLASARVGSVDEAWLKAAITERGGRVLSSDLPVPHAPALAVQRSLENQWAHWFYADAALAFPDCPVIRDHLARHEWRSDVKPATPDPRAKLVAEALFHPLAQDYLRVVAALGHHDAPLPYKTPLAFTSSVTGSLLPNVEDVYAMMTERGVLARHSDGTYGWGSNAKSVKTVLREIASSPLLGGASVNAAQAARDAQRMFS